MLSMYVLMCPCITDPALRAKGITRDDDIFCFNRCIERCERFGIEILRMPCPETIFLGKDREPTNFAESLSNDEFSELLDELEAGARKVIEENGEPLCIIGVDSSPSCGVNMTYASEEMTPGRGAFLSRFPNLKAVDVTDFCRYKIYLAGPLFTEAETDFNLKLHDFLEEYLFDVYLPQEVGDTSVTRHKEEHARIFEMHLAALEDCDYIVSIVDGADADSGTSWDMGYGYAKGKTVISLRTDFRCVGCHEFVNLMLEESSVVVRKKEDILKELGPQIL